TLNRVLSSVFVELLEAQTCNASISRETCGALLRLCRAKSHLVAYLRGGSHRRSNHEDEMPSSCRLRPCEFAARGARTRTHSRSRRRCCRRRKGGWTSRGDCRWDHRGRSRYSWRRLGRRGAAAVSRIRHT